MNEEVTKDSDNNSKRRIKSNRAKRNFVDKIINSLIALELTYKD